jgi:CelD/BcsL family acetyltransferase involved in cellulose biosynthesis
MSTTNDGWRLRAVRHPLYLFGRKLFDISAPLYVWERPFTLLPEDPNALVLPVDDGGGDPVAEGAFVRSQPVPADLPRLSRHHDLWRYAPSHYDRYTLTKTGTHADYIARWDSKRRYKLRAYSKNCLKEGKFTLHRTPSELDAFLDASRGLAQQTYQARVFGNQLPSTQEFRARVAALAAAERTIGALLTHKGKAAAFWWFTIDGDTLLSEFTGYDAELYRLSPGTALLWLIIEAFFADSRLRILDFGEGEAEYKRTFSTESRRCAEIYYLKPRVRPLTMVGLDSALWGTRRVLRPVERELERRGWKAKLKRLIRQS